MTMSSLFNTGVTVSSSSCFDCMLRPGVRAFLEDTAVRLVDPSTGRNGYILTTQPPVPGSKPYARLPIERDPFLADHTTSEVGGGGPNTALALADFCKRLKVPAEIRLIDSATSPRELRERCEGAGVALLSLNHHACPTHLVVQLPRDKLIVRSSIAYPSKDLSPDERRRIRSRVQDVSAVVSVSPKSLPVAEALWEEAQSAARYLQPTGSLAALPTWRLLRAGTVVICNFDEFVALAGGLECRSARASAIDEASSEAPEFLARLIAELFGATGPGTCEAIVVTRGCHGCLVFDLQRRHSYKIELLVSSQNRVSTPSGSGERFLAAYVLAREVLRATPGVSQSELAPALNASHRVAAGLGLASSDYDLRVSVRQAANRWVRLRGPVDSQLRSSVALTPA